MDSKQEKNKKDIIEEYVISVIFCLNLVGVVVLFFLFEIEGKFDTIIKVISGGLGGISGGMFIFFKSLVKFLNNEEKFKNVSFRQVLRKPPLNILNFLIFMGLLLVFGHKYFHEVSVKLYIENEFNKTPIGKVLIDQSANSIKDWISIQLKPGMKSPNEKYITKKDTIYFSLKPGKHSLTFTGDGYYEIQDSIYVPLFRHKNIYREIPVKSKKGTLHFKITPNDAVNSILEIDDSKKRIEPVKVQVVGNEYTTENLFVGEYGYKVSHQWYKEMSGRAVVEFNDTNDVEVLMTRESSGIRIKLDSESDYQDVGVFLDRQYREEYILGDVLEIRDFDTHLVELKDLENFTFYYSSHVSLSANELELVKTLECHLTPQPISYVEFYCRNSAEGEIFIDGQWRGSLDSYEGSIFLPVFDGYRDIKIGKWKSTIKFPVIGNYVEINKCGE